MSASDRNVVVRRVRADEHLELKAVRLSALAYSPHLAEHLARETAEPPRFWRNRAAKGAAADEMATFVAVRQEGFVGVADGFLSDDAQVVEIGGMWVSPSLRRAGTGRALLAAVCEWARERGAVRAGLWVRSANAPARLLYEREGFALARTSSGPVPQGMRLERIL